MASMGWSDESVLLLVEGYKARQSMWDPDHPDYKNIAKKNAHWASLADELQVEVEDLKKKLNSLTASFRRERAREKVEGRGYKSNWFAYSALGFLLEKFKGREPTTGGARAEYAEEVSVEDNLEEGFFFNMAESAYDDREDSSSHSTLQEPTTSGQHRRASGSVACKRPSRVQPARCSKTVKTEPTYEETVDVGSGVAEPISLNRCSTQHERSSIDIFGELVAAKLREYRDYTRIVVQQKINNILFDADMGLYNEPAQSMI